MKRLTVTSMVSASLFALALGSSVQAQQPATSGTFDSVEPLSAQSESFTLSKLKGKPVRGTNQEELSTVDDFLIDPKTGRVHFAVALSGSNTFRIIPMRALQPGSGQEGLHVQRSQAEWAQVGTMTAEQLQATVPIYTDHQERLARQFALSGSEPENRDLIRASNLKGRQLQSGNGQLGVVEDVVIDFQNQIAAPVVQLSGFAGGQKFLVPMQRLQITEGQPTIATTLTRNDFQTTQSQALAPTGNTGNWRLGQYRTPMGNAVIAVQQALQQRDASLGPANVQVVPESRLVLRGFVDSEQKKAEALQAAQQAAPGMQIDNQITVR